ncbi:aminoacyl-tRNA hydrolase [Helicobacter sp. MIT 14-3879]|uniref:aminoacyl-tRNA hydrolase n=1 Tax=Helicobacter sp. MIT 14-3879 TaxID=2040649 RepID=UPI000E1EB736|nr:aminoacyl-tRNA hydrolase [Helicobacter sp. MIT 14-3879]RDU62281.1 aminoacyl-tRNA hydrolase [Helicobacter sp. MIT 14-3879]
MKLIAALGNPTLKYENTRHNVGFMALDFYLKQKNLTLYDNKNFEAKILKNDDTIFLEPQTFMNLSGKSFQKVLSFYKIQKILVIHDDLDLKLGAIKFKFGGSSGGHNGLKSIDGYIGSEYFRVRIGIGRPQNTELNFLESNVAESSIINFVLEKFTKPELLVLDSSFELISKALDSFISNATLLEIQNLYTKKK